MNKNKSLSDRVKAALEFDEVQKDKLRDDIVRVHSCARFCTVTNCIVDGAEGEHARTRALTEALASCVSALEFGLAWIIENQDVPHYEKMIVGGREALAAIEKVLGEKR